MRRQVFEYASEGAFSKEKTMRKKRYFTAAEITIWLVSVSVIVVTFLIFDRSNYLSLFGSLVGVTAIIFCAKGNPIGQIMMLCFAVFYGIISISFRYYGEMITYLGMSAPMAVFSLISWVRHPYSKSEVRVSVLHARDFVLLAILDTAVTIAFYFILRALGNANLIVSTISVTTSFAAVYLTARRSPFYALAYALNDVVLIILWTMATIANPAYVSTLACFIVFLANDIYGFINWRRMHRRQLAAEAATPEKVAVENEE